MSNWIKWTKGLAQKREVMVIASLTGMTPREVAGSLMVVWEWADDNTEHGDVSSVTSALLQLTLALPQGFTEAMKSAGWLVETDQGISFPSFERHNSQSTKKRLLGAERQRRQRDKGDALCVTDVTPTPPPEKRREELKTPLPPCGGVSEFAQEFEKVFWPGCPVKRDKAKARAEYVKAREEGTEKLTILHGLRDYCAQELRRPASSQAQNPANWIRNRRWEDNPEAHQKPAEAVPKVGCPGCHVMHPVGQESPCSCRVCEVCGRTLKADMFTAPESAACWRCEEKGAASE